MSGARPGVWPLAVRIVPLEGKLTVKPPVPKDGNWNGAPLIVPSTPDGIDTVLPAGNEIEKSSFDSSVHTGPCSDFGGPAGNSMVRRKPGDTIPISLNSAAAHLLLRLCGWVAVGVGPSRIGCGVPPNSRISGGEGVFSRLWGIVRRSRLAVKVEFHEKREVHGAHATRAGRWAVFVGIRGEFRGHDR